MKRTGTQNMRFMPIFPCSLLKTPMSAKLTLKFRAFLRVCSWETEPKATVRSAKGGEAGGGNGVSHLPDNYSKQKDAIVTAHLASLIFFKCIFDYVETENNVSWNFDIFHNGSWFNQMVSFKMSSQFRFFLKFDYRKLRLSKINDFMIWQFQETVKKFSILIANW